MARTYLILGPSGRGKSTSFENLDKATTLIINSERKALPFKNSASFIQVRPKTVREVFETLNKYKNSDKLKTLVIDSFSSIADLIVHEMRVMYSGFDIWQKNSEKIYEFFKIIKEYNDNNIDVIVTGHDETLEGDTGTVKRLKVKGKEWEGIVEKEFDIVLWASVAMLDETNASYQFITQTNGVFPAKSPAGMLPRSMYNDMANILTLAHQYDGVVKEEIVETLEKIETI
jgi:ABC-type multidrug transport system ATPase subunit